MLIFACLDGYSAKTTTYFFSFISNNVSHTFVILDPEEKSIQLMNLENYIYLIFVKFLVDIW